MSSFGYWLYAKGRSMVQPYYSTEPNITNLTNNNKLYIGDIATSYNKEELESHGITHVVNCVYGIDPPFPDDFQYYCIPLCDSPTENVRDYFEESYEFINDAINDGGKVFVHCMCGSSRSATIVAAYLIRKGSLSVDEVMKFLKSKRPIIDPNEGFLEQLEEYSREVRGIVNQSEESLINN